MLKPEFKSRQCETKAHTLNQGLANFSHKGLDSIFSAAGQSVSQLFESFVAVRRQPQTIHKQIGMVVSIKFYLQKQADRGLDLVHVTLECLTLTTIIWCCLLVYLILFWKAEIICCFCILVATWHTLTSLFVILLSSPRYTGNAWVPFIKAWFLAIAAIWSVCWEIP